MRYPQPFPVHNQRWTLHFDDGDRPTISARIANQRLTVRLRGGQRYRRQLAAMRQIASGSAVQGELAFLRTASGEIECKLVAWLPRDRRERARDGVLMVATGDDAMLVAINEKDEKLWVYSADHIRRWLAEHARQLQRWRTDRKFENRQNCPFSQRQTRAVEKHQNRMKSALHQIAASVAGYAERRRLARVIYDDSCHGFCGDGFPYFRLAELIREKLDAKGVHFERRVAKDQAV